MILHWLEEGSPDGIPVDLSRRDADQAIRFIDRSLN
jgi:hypothetical protein